MKIGEDWMNDGVGLLQRVVEESARKTSVAI